MPKKKRPQAPTMQELGNPGSVIRKAFLRITPPSDAFDADKTWTHVYHDVSSFAVNRLQGQVTIRHQPKGKVHIESFRNCPDRYRYYTLADLTCSDKGWQAPTSWTVESKVAKTADGAARLNSGQTKKVSVKDGVMTVKQGKKTRTEKLPGLYTCKWCLLDAVGRLPKLGTKKVDFTLIDEYDELCPNQTIILRGRKKVKTKAGDIEVHCYQHTGTASVPGVFYVDAAGRVLFYLGGMQLLALAKAGRKTTGYLK